jgi:hypothetical protein
MSAGIEPLSSESLLEDFIRSASDFGFISTLEAGRSVLLLFSFIDFEG